MSRTVSQKMSTRNLIVLALAAGVSVGGFANLANGQVTLPPPEAAPKTPAYVPPPPAPAQPKPDPVEVKPRPVADKIPPNDIRILSQIKTDIPFDPWERDAEGHQLKLEEPVQWAAIRRNSAMKTSQKLALREFLEYRRRQAEPTVIDSVEGMRKIIDGSLDTFDFMDRDQRVAMRDFSGKFRKEVPDFHVEFLRTGRFNGMQTKVHTKAIDAYRRGVIDEFKLKAGIGEPDDKNRSGLAGLVGKAFETIYLDEFIWYYKWLAIEAVDLGKPGAEAIGVQGTVLEQYAAAADKAANAVDEGERFTLANAALRLLTVEQEQALLKHTVASRPPFPELPPSPVNPETGAFREDEELLKKKQAEQGGQGGGQPAEQPAGEHGGQPSDQPSGQQGRRSGVGQGGLLFMTPDELVEDNC